MEQTLEEKIVKKMLERKYTLTTIESCTGGLLAGRILNVPGTSSCYNEGYITYSNEAKVKLVNVSAESLEKYGAVSENVAKEMALGGARAAKADIGLSVTGIAGPTGGTTEKPVGLVYIGCAQKEKVKVKKCLFHGSREENRKQAVEEALLLLDSIL